MNHPKINQLTNLGKLGNHPIGSIYSRQVLFLKQQRKIASRFRLIHRLQRFFSNRLEINQNKLLELREQKEEHESELKERIAKLQQGKLKKAYERNQLQSQMRYLKWLIEDLKRKMRPVRKNILECRRATATLQEHEAIEEKAKVKLLAAMRSKGGAEGSLKLRKNMSRKAKSKRRAENPKRKRAGVKSKQELEQKESFQSVGKSPQRLGKVKTLEHKIQKLTTVLRNRYRNIKKIKSQINKNRKQMLRLEQNLLQGHGKTGGNAKSERIGDFKNNDEVTTTSLKAGEDEQQKNTFKTAKSTLKQKKKHTNKNVKLTPLSKNEKNIVAHYYNDKEAQEYETTKKPTAAPKTKALKKCKNQRKTKKTKKPKKPIERIDDKTSKAVPLKAGKEKPRSSKRKRSSRKSREKPSDFYGGFKNLDEDRFLKVVDSNELHWRRLRFAMQIGTLAHNEPQNVEEAKIDPNERAYMERVMSAACKDIEERAFYESERLRAELKRREACLKEQQRSEELWRLEQQALEAKMLKLQKVRELREFASTALDFALCAGIPLAMRYNKDANDSLCEKIGKLAASLKN